MLRSILTYRQICDILLQLQRQGGTRVEIWLVASRRRNGVAHTMGKWCGLFLSSSGETSTAFESGNMCSNKRKGGRDANVNNESGGIYSIHGSNIGQ